MFKTKEEQDWLLANLIIGCSWTHTNGDGAKAVINKEKFVTFSNCYWTTDWNYKFGLQYYWNEVHSFKWPEGTPMYPFTPCVEVGVSPIIIKCLSLYTRFENKTLPRCKTISLALP